VGVAEAAQSLAAPLWWVSPSWWALRWTDQRLTPGEARVNLLGCTNPSEPIDEDCSRYNRTVTLVPG
jgi:hypothetical protein